MWLDERQQGEVTSLDGGHDGWPVPTRMISNGEFLPIPQTRDQMRVEQELERRVVEGARKLGMSRRDFLRSSLGMATAFAALNSVFGTYFNDAGAAAIDPDVAGAVREKLRDQLVVDVQLHFVRDEADGAVKTAILGGNAIGLFNLRQVVAEAKWRDDRLATAKAEYIAAGGKPSNQYYGFIRRSTTGKG